MINIVYEWKKTTTLLNLIGLPTMQSVALGHKVEPSLAPDLIQNKWVNMSGHLKIIKTT